MSKIGWKSDLEKTKTKVEKRIVIIIEETSICILQTTVYRDDIAGKALSRR